MGREWRVGEYGWRMGVWVCVWVLGLVASWVSLSLFSGNALFAVESLRFAVRHATVALGCRGCVAPPRRCLAGLGDRARRRRYGGRPWAWVGRGARWQRW